MKTNYGRDISKLANQIKRQINLLITKIGLPGAQGRTLHFLAAHQDEDMYQKALEFRNEHITEVSTYDDFKEISFDYLKSQIEKGYISIAIIDSELIYNDIDILILRARNKNSPIIDFFTSNSPCILLTSTGCKLDYEHRPSGGKLMVPSENYSENFFGCKVHKCFSPYTIEDCCYEWEPHQKVLHELATYFFKKDYPCSL